MRIAHTVGYMAQLQQPWRTIVYLFNELILWIISVLLLIQIL